jgi:hypothetical protein
MSSPGARQRRRRQQYQTPRTRREVATAVAAAVGIVAATSLMIWLLRPGGLADRQPRSSWLVGLALLAALFAGYAILRPGTRVKVDRRIALSGSLAAIVVIAGAVGIRWPGGIVRHTPKAQSFTTTPTNPPVTVSVPAGGSSTTAKPGATTAPGGTTAPPTLAPGATTVPRNTTIPKRSTTTVKPPPANPSP